jgi:hypothetical protein
VQQEILEQLYELDLRIIGVQEYVDRRHKEAMYEVARTRHSIAGLKAHATRRRREGGQE